MNAMKWIGLGAMVAGVGVAACSGDDDVRRVTPARGGSSGHGGSSARGGGAGKATGGTSPAGRAGTPSTGGTSATAGRGGAGGNSATAGRGGAGGTSATAGRGSVGGRAGTAGSAGRAGNAGSAAAAGRDGSAGASGEGGSGGEGGEAIVPLRDAQILQVATDANQGEVAEGNIAVMRATSSAVRDFAQMMVADHSAAAQEALTLSNTIGVEPNTVSDALQVEANVTVMALNDASDDDFDAVYMDSQVTAHQEVLVILRSTLIPQADDGDLRALLSSMESTVEDHLNEARDVRDAL